MTHALAGASPTLHAIEQDMDDGIEAMAADATRGCENRLLAEWIIDTIDAREALPT